MSDKIDKVYDLLEKVYIELQGTKTELQDTKKEVKDNSLRLGKLETIIENEIKPDLKTLFEAQVQTNGQLSQINKKLEEHDKRFDILEVKVDALTAKTLRHSYEIGAIKRNRGMER